MKAKDISGQAPGGSRTRLADNLPLSTPYLLQFFPVYACNFKCKYCVFSVETSKRGFISDKVNMDFDLYKQCINDAAFFPEKIKVLRFVGMGEPLLHKNIADMVAYAKTKNVANKIEILTNASLLTPELSDALISAGLSRLVISIQGTSKEKYRQISEVDLDFEKFLNNLRYFYQHKKQVDVYIKIIDCAIENDEEKQAFYNIYSEMCDSMAVEHAVPIYPGVDYDKVLKDDDLKFTQFGLPVSEVKICPQPYFTMQINPDGKVVPCYSILYPAIMGDCNIQTVREIWNGKKYQHFRSIMLDGVKNVSGVCADCNIIKHRLFPEDDLKNDVERLRKIF